MNLSDFAYDLPPGRIAQQPVSPRDQSRLMLVPLSGEPLQHHRFSELADLLKPGDLLVLNKTRVFPSRLRGAKKTGGKAEALLLNAVSSSRWRALVRGATQATELHFPEGLKARMTQRLDEGEWLLEFSSPDVREALERHGEMPLPPYIKRPVMETADRECYQTVFAKEEGSVAAPTAGFHFTPELLDRLRRKRVLTVELLLHVGWGTFRPVRVERVEKHRMLPEFYEVSSAAAAQLNKARADKRRIIAVGTTTVRTLESVAKNGRFVAGQGNTSLFVYPGYEFRVVDGLITNFHLPDATPLLLACAFFTDRGPANASFPFSLKAAYLEAIQEDYRFYSYGDAMVML